MSTTCQSLVAYGVGLLKESSFNDSGCRLVVVVLCGVPEGRDLKRQWWSSLPAASVTSSCVMNS